MKSLLKFVFRSWQGWFLFLTPVAVAVELAHAPPLVVFLAAAAAIIPLAGLLGHATEELAGHMGPAWGGLMNASFGNAGELIIAFLALRAGHPEVVEASLTGSIIGNVLLVFGLSAFVGGIGRERQTFNRTAAGANNSMLILAVAALILPAIFSYIAYGKLDQAHPQVEALSRWTSGVLIAIYVAGLIFSLVTHRDIFGGEGEKHHSELSKGQSLTLLLVATGLIAWLSEIFVGAIEPATHALGMSKLFVGVIVVAMIGNAAEHAAAILLAKRNKMDLAVGISVGSSVQIALLVAPLLVFASYAMGQHLSLVFHPLEIAAVVLSVLVLVTAVSDGETNWFEGLQLLALYGMLGIAFYFVPA
jgi:Ca2+:H+ antiporter